MKVKDIMNGNLGELWLDGDKVSECFGLDAKVEFEKEEIPVCGSMATDTKIMGYKGTGSMKLYKVNSRMAIKLTEEVKNGENPRFQILSAIRPNIKGAAERVLIKDACFDDLTIAGWEAKAKGEVECPFTFTDWEVIDEVKPK